MATVSALETGDERTIRSLAGVHCELSELVAPATPHSLVLLEAEAAERSCLRLLGPVHLARRLAVVAAFFLLVVVGIEVAPRVHRTPPSRSGSRKTAIPVGPLVGEIGASEPGCGHVRTS